MRPFLQMLIFLFWVSKKFKSSINILLNITEFCIFIEPPTFVGNLRMETLGEYGSTVRISCDTIGVPQPKIIWYRNAERIGQNNR